MKNIHTKLTFASKYIKELSSLVPIKLSRLRERHASAMGFNSYNHLISSIKLNDIPSIDIDAYLKSLNAECERHHQITLDKEVLAEFIEDFIVNCHETVPLYIQIVPITSVNLRELGRYCTANILIDCGWNEDEMDGMDVLNGINIQYEEALLHGRRLIPRFLIHVNTENVAFPNSKKLGTLNLINYADKERLNEELANLIEYEITDLIEKKKSVWTKTYPFIRFEICGENANGINWNKYYQYEHDIFQFDDKEDVDEFLMNLLPALALYSPSYNHEDNTLRIGSLDLIYRLNFDSEFIDAYNNIASKIKSSLFTANKVKSKVIFVNSCDENECFEGFIRDGLYLDTITDLSGKDRHEHPFFEEVNQDNFQALMIKFGVTKVVANTLISHNDGCAIIWGCKGIDTNGKPQINFQLFSCPYPEYAVFDLFKSIDIELKVLREDEFEYTAEPYNSISSDKMFIYETPEFAYDAFNFGLLIYHRGEYFDYKNTQGFHAQEFPQLFNGAVSKEECATYDIRIMPPMPVPISFDEAKKSINAITKGLYEKGVTERDHVENAIVKEMHQKYTCSNPHLCVSLITFDAIGDHYDRLKWNINVVQHSGTLTRHEDITGKKSPQGFDSLINQTDIHPDAYGNHSFNDELGGLTGMKDIKLYFIKLF